MTGPVAAGELGLRPARPLRFDQCRAGTAPLFGAIDHEQNVSDVWNRGLGAWPASSTFHAALRSCATRARLIETGRSRGDVALSTSVDWFATSISGHHQHVTFRSRSKTLHRCCCGAIFCETFCPKVSRVKLFSHTTVDDQNDLSCRNKSTSSPAFAGTRAFFEHLVRVRLATEASRGGQSLPS